MITKVRLALGGLLLVAGVLFAAQNSHVVEVRFLGWSLHMSQALVIVLTGAAGTMLGFFVGTALRLTRRD